MKQHASIEKYQEMFLVSLVKRGILNISLFALFYIISRYRKKTSLRYKFVMQLAQGVVYR